METRRFVYYEENGMFIGWLEDFPDYRTQGETMDELRENLRDIYEDLTAGHIPCVHKMGEVVVG